MEHFYILVTDMDGDDVRPPSGFHASSTSRAATSRSLLSTTRSGQPSSAGEDRALFDPPGLSHILNPPTGAAFGASARESGASLALYDLVSSLTSPGGGALSGSSAIPPRLPMSATRIFSSFPLGAGEGNATAPGREASNTHSASRAGRTAGTNTPESRISGLGGIDPLLEEILQRTFSHVSAESFISEFVRRTIEVQPWGNPPASQFAMDNLQEVVAPGMECCTVCQEEFEEGEQTLGMPCSHSFHRQCLLRWLAEHNTCPVCRCEIESHCARYNQANFDKLKGKLHCKTMDNHNNPSKMEPPPTTDFMFGGALGGTPGAPSAPSRTLRMTLRMPAGTLSWLGAEVSSSTARVRSQSSMPSSSQTVPPFRRSNSATMRAAASQAREAGERRPSRAGAAAELRSSALQSSMDAPAGPGSSSSANMEAPPRPPARALPRTNTVSAILRPFVAALQQAERGMLERARAREGDTSQARETRGREGSGAVGRNPEAALGRGQGRKRRRGADAEANGTTAPGQEREANDDMTPVAARTRQRINSNSSNNSHGNL